MIYPCVCVVKKTSPGFGRSNPFEQKQSDEQKVQRDQYKDYLQMQVGRSKYIF